MKMVVIGGTGRIGANVVSNLRAQGHEAVAASPRSGVNALTGEGVAEALAGATLRVCTLIPDESAHLGATHVADWLTQITLQQ